LGRRKERLHLQKGYVTQAHLQASAGGATADRNCRHQELLCDNLIVSKGTLYVYLFKLNLRNLLYVISALCPLYSATSFSYFNITLHLRHPSRRGVFLHTKSPAQHLKCTQDYETCYEIFGLQVFPILLNRTLNLVHALPYIGNSNECNTDTVGKYARDNHADTANEE